LERRGDELQRLAAVRSAWRESKKSGGEQARNNQRERGDELQRVDVIARLQQRSLLLLLACAAGGAPTILL